MSAYLLAILATVVAVVVRWLLDPWLGNHLALVTLFAAVAATEWYGGSRPAVLTTILGYLACGYLFIEPRGSLGVQDIPNAVGLLAYLVSCSLLIGFGEAMRLAQQRAREGQELLRVTFASIGDAIITTDLEGRITYLNAVAESLTGWTQAAATGQPLEVVFRIVNEQTRQRVENPATRALREGTRVGLANHTILITRDGIERPIDDSAAPIRDGQGRLAGCVLVFRDVTDRRRTEQALQRSERELADFFDNASIGLHWGGPDGVIQRVNQAELEMLGYQREEYVGRHIADFHVDRAVIDEIFVRLTRGETLRDQPAKLRCKDGSIRDVLLNSSVLFENGQFIHTRCFTIDITGRKKAERAQAWLAALVAASEDAIVSKTLEGIILSWNAGAERLFGYTSAEAVGRSITMLIPPELQDEELSILARLRQGERIEHFETVRIDKFGRRLDISLTISPIRDETGRVVAASKVARNITDRKQAELARRQFFALAESSSEFVGLCDLQLKPFYVNPAGLRMVGLESLEQARQTSVGEFFFPEDRQPILNDFLPQVLREGRGEVETRFRHLQTGQALWVIYSVVTLTDEQGKPTALGTVTRDITQRKLAEEALRQSEERFRELANNITQFAWSCDQLGCATWYNRRWYEYTGTTFAEMQGDGWTKVLHPDHLGRVVAELQRCVATGQQWEDTFPLRGKDGNYRWFLSRSVPICDDSGRVIRWFGTNTDITQQRELEEALRDADRRKDEFLATLAHELRNPLAPIRNAVQILLVQGAIPPESRWPLEVIDRQVQHMARLLDDLLDVSRISHNKLELRQERVELAAVIRSAVETSRPLIDSARHELTVLLPPDPLYLQADPVRLSQIFANLLNNAAKYTDPGGHIRLTGERQGSDVVVTVKDDGIGIAAEVAPHIFDMFSQEKGVLERSQGGLGIGLSLVRGLTELHGGSIAARSEGPGRGSEFVVRLPLLLQPLEEQLPMNTAPEPVQAPKRRLLIVDDRKDNADSLALLLKIMGHEVHTAYDGEEAVVAATNFKPEVVLLDIGMPKLNGYDACRHIRQQPGGKDMFLVAVTGWGQKDDRRRTEEAGFNHHMVKPVDPDALIKLLATLSSESVISDQ